MNSRKLFFIRKLLWFCPETHAFGLKRKLYRWGGVCVGDNVKINSSAVISGTGHLVIGANTWVGPEAMIVCSAEIKIGVNCDIAPRVYIGDGTHGITPERERIAGADVTKPISIGDGCWLCTGSAILPGVSIGKKCVVAAGAVVTKGCEDAKLLAGVPAIEVRSLL